MTRKQSHHRSHLADEAEARLARETRKTFEAVVLLFMFIIAAYVVAGALGFKD